MNIQIKTEFNDNRDNDEEERSKQINKELNKKTIHKKLQKPHHNDVMMDFGAASLYPSAISAMWDENSVNAKTEIGIAFKPHLKNGYVESFKNQTLNQDSDESAILRIIYYNLPDLIFQHLPVKGKVKKIKSTG